MNKTERHRPRVAILGRKLEGIKGDISVFTDSVITTDPNLDSESNELDWSKIDIIISAGDHGGPSHVHHLVLGFEKEGEFRSHSGKARVEPLAGNMGVFQSAAEQLFHAIEKSGQTPDGIEFDLPDVTTSPIVSSSTSSIAALYTMDTGSGRILSIPELADVGQWFKAFTDYLHIVDPAAVPQAVSASSVSDIWYTPREKAIRDEIEATRVELDQLQQKSRDLTAKLETATAEADKQERSVLWDGGQELAKSVGALFEGLGFRIKFSEKAADSDVEDLYLTPSDGSRRIAIVKVRGYAKDVERSDLQSLNRHSIRFAADQGREADLSLLVVNPFRNVDPSFRSHDADHQLHDQAVLINAAVIKTVDLYKVWRDCALGELDPAEAQEKLFAARLGVWQY